MSSPILVAVGLEFIPESVLLVCGFLAFYFAIPLLAAKRTRDAVRVGFIAITCMVAAFTIAHFHESARATRMARMARASPNPLAIRPAGTDSTGTHDPWVTLDLGGVRFQVPIADHYCFSVGGVPFLELDSLRTGLTIGCLPAVPMKATPVDKSPLFPRGRLEPAALELTRVDPHTLHFEKGGKEVVRVRYVNRRTIEVVGDFTVPGAVKSYVSFVDGVQWKFGSVPVGSPVDLSGQCPGRIDFERDGSIRVFNPP